MNREEIKATIETYRHALNNNERIEINAMMVDQNNQRKARYKGYMLKLSFINIKPIVVKALEFIEDELTKKPLGVYDLEISIDDVIQMEERQKVVHGEEILSELSVDYNNNNTIQETTDFSKIKFVVIQVFFHDKSIFLFQKYIQPSTAFQTTEKFIFSGSQLRPFDKKILTLNCSVDAFLFDDTYYILNRNAFNSFFAYKDVFKRILVDNTEAIRNSGLLQNTDQFIKDCEADGRHLTRLTKAILAQGFQKVAEKKKNIKKVVQDFNLSLAISDQDEIIYRDKADVPDILNLLLRHFVIDALTSDKMIAAAIQNYKIEK